MKYIFPFFLCTLFAGCFSEGDCLISATNQLHIQFKKRSNSKLDTLITFNSIVVSGTDVIFTLKSSTANFLLPLDTNSDSTQFIFKRVKPDNSIATDTLQLGYDRQGKVITKDCGAYTYYRNLKILKKTSLDSTQIKIFNTNLLKDPNSSAITAYALNFQIFY
ncbi:MAG: hypothetical protein HY015_06655 [Bacteroidetes bacterium]|nr:hypothetical protein [Bacteroidota bacterium]MBI3482644.1 hypothetical protein [Bacteroidota bacterium]